MKQDISETRFSRSASGLPRSVGGLDAFIFNLGMISIGVTAAYTQRFGTAFYPNCSLVIATLMGALLAGAVALGFWAWTSSVPRSGGIYVFIARAGFPALGQAISLVELIAWLFYLCTTSSMFVIMGVAPLAMSFPGPEPYFVHIIAGSPGLLVVGSFAIWLAAWVAISGMQTFLRSQRIIFVIAIIGTLALFHVLSHGPAEFHQNFNAAYPSFGQDPYQVVIAHAKAAGWFGAKPGSLKRTVALLVWPFLALMAAVFSMNIGGEIRHPAKTQLRAMIGSLAAGALAFLLIAVLAKHSIGNAFQGAIAYNYENDSAKGMVYSTQVEPYFGYFACLATQSPLMKILITLGFICWAWFWIPGILSYAARVFLAWSTDGAAPAGLAKLHPTRGTPYVAILVAAAIAQVLLPLILFTHLIGSLVFILGIVGAWGAALCLGALFPVTTPNISADSSAQENQPPKRLPMSLLCATGAAAILIVGYLLWRDPEAAGHDHNSLAALLLTFLAGLLFHFSMRIRHRRAP
ncbi:MAG: hypothetical protein ABSF29_09025 [Tepidisphaeraceae bacterium]